MALGFAAAVAGICDASSNVAAVPFESGLNLEVYIFNFFFIFFIILKNYFFRKIRNLYFS